MGTFARQNLNPFRLLEGIVSPSTPAAPEVVMPAARTDAAAAAEPIRRTATARGRAATILTGELGAAGMPGQRRRLGVG
jgi:hypothetical protein